MSATFVKKYSLSILLSIGFFSVVLLHATELRLRTVYPDPTYAVLKGVMANSADTDNYLSIAENYLAGNGLRLNGIEGGVSYFGRMPGYSFLYLAFRSICDPVTSLLCMKWLQIALFLVSIFCLYRTITILSDERTAGVLTLIYTLVPCFYSFTFYILTEAITGFMLVFATYTTVRAWHTAQPRNKLLLYAAASFLIGYLMLSRPVLGMYILGLAVVVYADYRRHHLTVGRLLGNMATAGLPFAAILASWMIHIFVTTGEVVVLSKYTHPTSASLYKLPTWGLWSVGQSWGEDGVVFNTYGVPLYYGAIAGDTSDALVEPAITTWKAGFPPVAELGDERLREGIKLYQRAVILQKPYVENKKAMPDEYLTEELAAYSYLTGIRDELKSRHPFVYHVKAPLTYLRMAVLNSGTSNIYMFQERFRSEQLLNVLRFGLLAFNICLYLVLFINMLTLRKTLPFIFFVVIPILYLIVLCYFVRSLEQRYMFPIYPLLLISACYPLQRFIFRNKPAPLPL